MAFQNWKEIAPDQKTITLSREKNLSATEAMIVSRLLHPSLEPAFFSGEPLVFPASSSLPDIARAAERIALAVRNGEKILVHGDYDTDGLMGTAVMVSGLTALGASVAAFVPSRFDDGYGLSAASVEAAKKQNARLMVTVDCGTNAGDIEKALALNGIDLVVSDHHIPEENNLVKGIIVNPHFGESEEMKTLAGATVGYLLLRETAAVMGVPLPEEPFLRLCAIATISDVVPVSPFNWKLCRKDSGPSRDAQPRPDRPSREMPQPPFRSHHIAYYLAPRLNAAGRMEDGNLVLEILLERDQERARLLVDKLEALNKSRRFTQNQMAEEVEKHFDAESDIAFLFCASDRFHKGLLGPVASRLAQERGICVFLIAVEARTHGIGESRRRVRHNGTAQEVEGIFTRLGGHQKAAGFTMQTKNISKLRDFLDNNLTKNADPEASRMEYFLLKPDQAELAWNSLGGLDPIDHSLQPPYFAFELASLSDARVVKDKHLLWNIQLPGGYSFSAFYFDAFTKIKEIPSRDRTIVGRLLPDKIKTRPNFFFEVKDII